MEYKPTTLPQYWPIKSRSEFNNAVIQQGHVLLFSQDGETITAKKSDGSFVVIGSNSQVPGAVQIEAGYINANGNFQPLSFNGTQASDSGSAVAGLQHKIFNTGHDEPDYGGSGIQLPNDACFYQPLSTDVTTQTGQATTATGITFNTQAGITAAVFDGEGYISFSDSGLPEGTSTRSFSFWFRRSTSVSDNVVINYGTDTAGKRFGIFIADTGITLGIGGNSASIAYAFAANKWYNIVVIYANGFINLCVDGGQISSATAPSLSTELTGTGYIGYRNGTTLNGMLAGVRVFNRALTAADIYALAREFVPTA